MEYPPVKRADLVRSPESYTTMDICHYANEMLRRCNESPVDAETSPYCGWDTEAKEFKLRAQKFDQPTPIYRLHIKSKVAIEHPTCYVFSESAKGTILYDADGNQISSGTLFGNDIDLMMHLRSHPDININEPQNTPGTRRTFQNIMAHLALDDAQESGKFSMSDLATGSGSTHVLYEYLNMAHVLEDAAESSFVFTDLDTNTHFNNRPFFFMQSTDALKAALDEQILDARKKREEQLARLALPPPPKNDDTS